MPNRDDPVLVTLQCCPGPSIGETLANIQDAPLQQFICPRCRSTVAYDHAEYLRLLNQPSGPYEITLRLADSG
jgi:hypothetical protein